MPTSESPPDPDAPQVRLEGVGNDVILTCFRSINAAAVHAVPERGRPRAGVFVAMNAEKAIRLRREPDLFSALRHPIFYADGSSMLLLAPKGSPKIAGVELWLRIVERGVRAGMRILVVGATPDVSDTALAILSARHPGAVIAAVDGFRAMEHYRALVRRERPDIVFVAMGSPRQESVIGELQAAHDGACYMGIGGSLDVLAGEVRRAPRALRRMHMEFLYRLVLEPRRLLRQTALPRFALLLLTGRVRARSITEGRTRAACRTGTS